MTTRGGCPHEPRGHHVAHFPLIPGDTDVIEQQCHQWSAVGKGQLVHGGLPPRAKGRESLSQRGDIHLLRRLRLELAPQLGQALGRWPHRLSLALARVTPQELCAVDFQPPRLLPCERGKGVTPGRASGLPGLWPPFPAVGPGVCMSNVAA
jgi:hypothetical protein